MRVPIPEKRMARLGSNPIRIGATTVAPNMAGTCWNPIAIVWPQGSLSSGLTIPDRVSFQERIIVLLLAFPAAPDVRTLCAAYRKKGRRAVEGRHSDPAGEESRLQRPAVALSRDAASSCLSTSSRHA